jgi:hypothetical protein
MMQRALTLILLFILPLLAPAQEYKTKKFKKRIYFGPAIASYKNNTDFTVNTRPRMGVNLGVRFEYMFNGYNSLCFAAEYLTHGLSFDSYYFDLGQVTLYDKTFPYHHQARLHEAQLPVLFKYNFQKENNKARNTYLLIGWGYRYILASYSYITNISNGRAAWEGPTDATAENPLLLKRGSSMLMAGIGFERNNLPKERAIYLELLYKYGLSRFQYNGSGTAAPFFIKDAFTCINVGAKF